jgi:hypothetical protein
MRPVIQEPSEHNLRHTPFRAFAAPVRTSTARKGILATLQANHGLGHKWCPGKDSNLHGR